MKLSENFKLAFIALLSNKIRTMMTMLGIIIGIASVICIVNTGDAQDKKTAKENEKYGAGQLSVMVQPKDESASFDAKLDSITLEQIDQYKEKFADLCQGISYFQNVDQTSVKKGNTKIELSVFAVNEDYQPLSAYPLLEGRNIDRKDIEKKHYVCLVTDYFVKKYYHSTNLKKAIGKKITVSIAQAQKEFEIIGIIKEDEYAEKYNAPTEFMFPISIYDSIKGVSSPIQNISIKPKDGVNTELFETTSTAFWKSTFSSSKTSKIEAYSGTKYSKSMEKQAQQAKLTMGAVGAISLLVGGIGVMNIMMVSVTERTREIGIRMALGAKNREILEQFIIEAMAICLIGGIIGIVIGSIAGMAISNALYEMSVYPSIYIIVIALGFSMAVGVFFGFYPAKRASDLDPIEALRYE